MELRPYQKYAIDLVTKEFVKGKRKILVHLATGAGKGLLMSQLTHNALLKGSKVLTVMRRRELIFQTIENYNKYHSIKSSPVMAGIKGMDSTMPCQVSSIDTLRARMKNGEVDFLKAFDVVIVDEAHDSNSPTYQDFFEFMGEKAFIGFSATPYMIGNKALKFWQVAVKPIEVKNLKDLGFIADAKIYAPTIIDVKGIKVKQGDFDSKELFKRVSESAIVGDIVNTYAKFGNNLPAILFAMNKEHSKIMCEAFKSAGFPASHQDESSSSEERRSAINDLVSGKIKILCNVNIFSTGVDIPSAIVGIMARPTMSEILWIQQVGRLLRPHPTKKFAIILDHAGNTFRHGGPYLARGACLEIDGAKKQKRKINAVVCASCFAIYAKAAKCPDCGFAREVITPAPKIIKQIDGMLEEVSGDEHPIVSKHRELLPKIKLRGKSEAAAWYYLHGRFGNEIYKYLSVPKWMRDRLREKDKQNEQRAARASRKLSVQPHNLSLWEEEKAMGSRDGVGVQRENIPEN